MNVTPEIPVSLVEKWLSQRIRLDGECWIWTGRIDHRGYGRITARKRSWNAHRAVYTGLVGSIPDELELDHTCRTLTCVNPAHLEPVSRAENMRRRYLLITTCGNGHPYDDMNTYIRPNGHRDCRQCIRDRVARYKERRMAA